MWADAEELTRSYLLGALSSRGLSIPVATTVPRERPPRFVRLMASGSSRRTIVHRDTRITVEVWGSTSEAATASDAEAVYEALDEWELVPDFDGWASGPYPQPDPNSGAPRYVMTCIVRHRLEA